MFCLLATSIGLYTCMSAIKRDKITIDDKITFLDSTYSIAANCETELSFINKNPYECIDIPNCKQLVYSFFGDGWSLLNTNGNCILQTTRNDIKLQLWHPQDILLDEVQIANVSELGLDYRNGHIGMSFEMDNNRFLHKCIIIQGTTNSIIRINASQRMNVIRRANWYERL